MQTSTSSTWQIVRQWLTVVAVLMAIGVNALSNFFPPAGKNIGQISNTTFANVLITPEGYAFAIWGLIYLGLIAFSIYQALPQQRQVAVLPQVSCWLIGACELQMLWVYVFLVSQFWLSVVLMFGILLCLANAYVFSRRVKPSQAGRWLVQAPMGVYFGWITVASVVNVASALIVSLSAAWSAPSAAAVAWTVVMMTVSASLAAVVALRYKDVSFPAVAVWALCAIAIRQSRIVPIAFSGIALAVGLVTVIIWLKASRRPKTS